MIKYAAEEANMARLIASALVTDDGQRVLFRINERCYELTQGALRALLGLPEGPPGVGITINCDRLQFEFPLDQQSAELTAKQLQRRLAKHFVGKA
jgi:hypothetical protein